MWQGAVRLHSWKPMCCGMAAATYCMPRGAQAAASEAAVKVVLILQNLVFLLFMAALAWIFRWALPAVRTC